MIRNRFFLQSLTLFIFILFLGNILQAGDLYWQNLDQDTLQIKGGTYAPGLNFDVETPSTAYRFRPEAKTALFTELAYNNLSIGLRLSLNGQEHSTAPSSIRDFQFRFFSEKWTYEAIHQRFKGFTLEGWSNSGAPYYRPDMGVETTTLNVFYNFSPSEYSPSVAYDQNGVQLKSGGGFSVWGSLARTHAFANSPFIPLTAPQDAGETQTLRDVTLHYLLVGVGYGHTWPCWQKFYATISTFIGYGIQSYEASIQTGLRDNWNSIYRIGLRPGIGYNHGSQTAGLQVFVDSNVANVLNSDLRQSTLGAQLFYGVRFSDVKIPLID